MNLPPRRPLKLRTKITLYFVGLLVAWTAVIVSSIAYVQTRTAGQFFRERGEQIARTLTAECVPLVYYEDFAGIDDLLHREMKAHRDIRYIVLLDATGVPIWDTFPGGVPADLLEVPHPTGGKSTTSVQLVRADGELLYDYACGGSNLDLRLGLSLAPVRDPLRKTASRVLWIGLAGFLAVFALALKISRPVEALTQAIEHAVRLDEETRGTRQPAGTLETSAIAERFQEILARLEERTRQLDASRKLAYLGELSASIAHEVNNPLGILVLNGEFLARRVRSGELAGPVVEEVDRLVSAARKATLAAQKLLQFARYSRGTDPPASRPIRVEALVRETAALLEDRVRRCGCGIEVDVDPDLTVRCDEQGLQQVLLNLVANALDSCPEGTPIEVRARLERGLLVLSVTDHGPGISREVLSRAFDPFFTTKEPGRGTGLGLSISDSIIRAHGGEIVLESDEGAGTTATVRLPVTGNP